MNLLREQFTFLVMNVLRFAGVIVVFQLSDQLSFAASEAVMAYAIFSATFYFVISLFVLFALRGESAGNANTKR